MALDSKAAFKERATEAGISNGDMEALEREGITTFSKYAFCCAYQPGSPSDDALFDYLESVLGARPTGASAANYRRLFFECHAMFLKDLQSRLERSDTSDVKILPLAEKVQRVENLRKQLPGVMLSTTLEPSHALIDKAVHQSEENCIKLIELHTCTSREQEIKCEKSSPSLSFDSNRAIKVTKQSAITECSIQGDIRLRAAFTRRSLAYTLANIASFEVLEGWTQLLFDRVCQEPPAGYRHISIDQIVAGDRKLWVKISEFIRSKVNVTVDGLKSVDSAIQKFSHDPEVLFHMLPLPSLGSSSASASSNRFSPYNPSPRARAKGNPVPSRVRVERDQSLSQTDVPSNLARMERSQSARNST